MREGLGFYVVELVGWLVGGGVWYLYCLLIVFIRSVLLNVSTFCCCRLGSYIFSFSLRGLDWTVVWWKRYY